MILLYLRLYLLSLTLLSATPRRNVFLHNSELDTVLFYNLVTWLKERCFLGDIKTSQYKRVIQISGISELSLYTY